MKRGASHLVDPLKKSAAPLGCGGVAVKGVLVALRGLEKGSWNCPRLHLHVSEDVRGRLVQGGNLGRGAVGELDVGEVSLYEDG